MHFYYQPIEEEPGRRRFSLAVADRDFAREAPKTISAGGTLADGSGSLYVDEEVSGNAAVIAGILRWLAPHPVGSLPPPRYRAAPPNQIELPDGTLFTPITDPDREALFAQLASTGAVARLQQIRDNVVGSTLAQTQAAVRDLAIQLGRTLRRMRQREGSSPED